MHNTVLTIVKPLLEDSSGGEPMDVDGEPNGQKEDEL